MEIIYAFDPNSEFQKTLQRAAEKIGDLRVPLGLIAQSWFKSNRSIFDLNRKSAGRYKDLSTKPFFAFWEKDKSLRKYYEGGYKEYKQAKYGRIYPVLYATGRLARSITDPEDSEAINIITNRNTLLLGTKVPYGVYHQSQQTRSKIPYRPFLFVGVEQIAPHDIKQNRLKIWMKILETHMGQVLDKNK